MGNAYENGCKRVECARNTQGIRTEYAGNTHGMRVKNVPFKTTFLYECLKRLQRFKRRPRHNSSILTHHPCVFYTYSTRENHVLNAYPTLKTCFPRVFHAFTTSFKPVFHALKTMSKNILALIFFGKKTSFKKFESFKTCTKKRRFKRYVFNAYPFSYALKTMFNYTRV